MASDSVAIDRHRGLLGDAYTDDHPRSRWFHVRYADHRGQHLRVRVDRGHMTAAGYTSEDFAAMSRGLAQSVSAVIQETYHPEDARFGGRGLRVASRNTFTASTELVTRFLETAASGRWAERSTDDLSMLFAVGSTARILAEFGISATEIVGFAPLGGDGNDLWRRLGADLKEVVKPWPRQSPNIGTDMHDWLTVPEHERLWQAFGHFGRLLRSHPADFDTGKPVVGSIVHMHFNRITARSRSFEPTAYSLLTKVDRTLQGRPDMSIHTGAR